jgi:predicted RNase H-like nuclease
VIDTDRRHSSNAGSAMSSATVLQCDTFVVGVDGCRAGWIAVARNKDGLDYRLHATFAELLQAWPSAASMFVDIPIGLPSRSLPTRRCDTEARRLLGPGRASSVFSPPCREAAHAADLGQAREINLRELGRSLSTQAWGICPKIAEVDSLLGKEPALVHRVKEVHPELLFWALNDGRAMQHAKKSREGAAERAVLIERLEPRAREFIEHVLQAHRRVQVSRDDMIDALAAMLTVDLGPVGAWSKAATVPAVPEVDDRGLPMCMWISDGSTA